MEPADPATHTNSPPRSSSPRQSGISEFGVLVLCVVDSRVLRADAEAFLWLQAAA